MQEQQSQALTENAKKLFEEEMALMKKDAFKPLEFKGRKSNDKKTCKTYYFPARRSCSKIYLQRKYQEEMEVFSLERITGEAEVLVIQNSKEYQPRLTRRWSAVSNLAKTSDEKSRPNVWMQEWPSQQLSQALTENAERFSGKEIVMMEKDVFKPLEFNTRKKNDKKTKFPSFDRVFVIRF
ncbi:hypothetical protein ACROYT_G039040 [Oculina patagonica]